MNLKQKTIRSFKWLFLAKISQKALSFITFVILARILEPSVFGLFALAFVVIDGLGMFQSLGIDSALIQRKDKIEKAADTAFFIFPVVGIILFLVLYFFAPFASIMLKEPSLTPVIRVLGLFYIIKCFSRVPSTLYVKNLDFKTKTLIEITADLFYSITAVILAINKFGVFSLVYAYLLKQVIILIGFWRFCPWRPRLEFDWHIAKELIHFGKFIFGASLIWFLVGNLDRAIIGRLLGTAMLGYYALAFNIANLTSTHLTRLISQVMFCCWSIKNISSSGVITVIKWMHGPNISCYRKTEVGFEIGDLSNHCFGSIAVSFIKIIGFKRSGISNNSILFDNIYC